MLRNIILFYNLAQKAVEHSGPDHKVTWNQIRGAMGDLLYKITSMKFQNPADGEQALVAHFKSLQEDIHQAFRNLGEE